MRELMNHHRAPGAVVWIGIRIARRAELTAVDAALLDPVFGMQGDHYTGRSGRRQVTLIQAEHLQAVAGMLHQESISPQLLRRNIVVSGINLLALKDQTFQLGEAILEFTGLCHPCSRMEENLGIGGYNAMRGHGGITARVLRAGWVRTGDTCLSVSDMKGNKSES